MKKFLIGLFVFIIAVLFLAFFGFKYATSSKPRDLGITYTDEDVKQSYLKNGVIAETLPKTENVNQSIRYEGKKEISFSLTQNEITALINNEKWQYMPVSNVQIKINPDGTGEVSGVLHIDRILPFVSLTHSTEEVEEAMNKYGILNNTSFYLKGKVNVINNKVTLIPTKIEVGRITIPSNLVSENIGTAENFAERRIKAVPNLFVESLSLDDGKVNFKGTMPEKQFRSE